MRGIAASRAGPKFWPPPPLLREFLQVATHAAADAISAPHELFRVSLPRRDRPNEFWGWGSRFPLVKTLGSTRAPLTPSMRYNARVDRLDAIRLLKALVAAGAKPRAPMDSAWIDEIAVRDVSLHGTQLASALAYAEGEGWLVDSPRKGWVSLTRAGEVVARVK